MKRISANYNELLRTFIKAQRRLANLKSANKNERRQYLLMKRIQKLQEKLVSLNLSLKMTTAAASVVVGSFLINPNTASAQTFLPVEVNPFNITPLQAAYGYSAPTFVDLDGDGDYDMVSAHYIQGGVDGYTYETRFRYSENTGTNTNPNFSAPVDNPFAMEGVNYNFKLYPTFADIDNDGDMDLFYGHQNVRIYFQENTGTATNPNFAAPVENPFGIGNQAGAHSMPTFVDIDGDGDLDLFVGSESGAIFYFQNTGDANAPAFGAAVSNYAGLNISTLIDRSAPTFYDLDGDGDYDLLSGEVFGNLLYFENTGTNTNPAFAAQVNNPFGLTAAGTGYSTPVFVDLDGDGAVDIMAGSLNSNFYFFKQEKDCTGLEPDAPEGLANQEFCAGLTVEDIEITTGENIKWYDAELEGDLIPTETTLEDNSNYYATQTVDGCESTDRLAVAVTTFTVDSPEGEAEQELCKDATLEDLSTTSGDNILWYATEVGGEPLDITTDVVDNSTYYASQTVDGCESEDRLSVEVSLIPNISVSVAGDENQILTADEADATYQWVDCDNGDAPISGATEQNFTPTESGNYAVEITKNGCTDVSGCTAVSLASTFNPSMGEKLKVYPNPTNGIVSVELPSSFVGNTIEITNSLGQVLEARTIEVEFMSFDLKDVTNGIYFVKVYTESGMVTKKVIKN